MRRGNAFLGWWLAAVVAVSSGCSTSKRADPPPDVANALGQRVASLLEHNFGEQIAPHHSDNLTCAARVFGIDPSTANRVGQVSTVYAWAYCEERLSNDAIGNQISVPVAIHLASPPSIKVPLDGEAYPDTVAKIFPSELRHTATYPPPYVDELARQVAATRPGPQHT